MSNIEYKKLKLENRISKLRSSLKENANIIRKAERNLRNLSK